MGDPHSESLSSAALKVEEILYAALDSHDRLPFLFVGSGLSLRFLGIPTWGNLLREMANQSDQDFEYVRSMFEDNQLPEIAGHLAREYNEKWYKDDRFESRRERYRGRATAIGSTLKFGIADFIGSFNLPDQDKVTDDTRELIEELKLLRRASIDGIITTNYDQLLEWLFPDFKVFVGHDDIMFGGAQFVGEIFKIHGSVTEPESMILTEKDYEKHAERNAYLAAKLLTTFVERPVVFLGYSLSDNYIVQILNNIAIAAGDDGINRLRDRIYFVEWEENPNSRPAVGPVTLGQAPVFFPATHIKANSFAPIFRALARLERRLPAVMLRQLREVVYETVEEQAVNGNLKEFRLVSIDDPLAADLKTVYGIGLGPIDSVKLREINAAINDSNLTVGGRGVSRDELLLDALEIRRLPLTDSIIVEATLPTMQKGSQFPGYKYIRGAGKMGDGGEIDKESVSLDVIEMLSQDLKVPDQVIRRFCSEFSIADVTIASLLQRRDLPVSFRYPALLLVPVERVDVQELREAIVEMFKESGENVDSYFSKAVAYFDRLSWKPRFDEDWSAWQKVNVSGTNDS